MASVIILGAKGRFGRAAAQAFATAGWTVTWAGRGLSGADCIDVDATDAEALQVACAGHDVIVNAVNPPYDQWLRTIPKLTNAVIVAARVTGATVMIPGNIYNYGRLLPPVLREDTPWVANTRKGGIRIRMERAYRDSGVRTVVLRGGDFIDIQASGNWFESHIAPKAGQGKLTYPGPRDQVHAWAYLPDMARAMVGLAEKRDQFSAFEEFCFDGYALTGNALIAHVAKIIGKPMRVSRLPWSAVWVMGLWSPLMREVFEMRYLWRRPHAMDGSKLRAVLPAFQPTPVEEALAVFLKKETDAYGEVAARA
ncbi:NAD-dependent epimerase/dehydratase family protein [uncultured Tateyamaria sp.]|uniref:NAD-dependent epimerase/dehydratase family protein n=1 Tax=uncultured Tateyamaria sp. TaxID=455651 RepID=UPI002623FA12|nr:NAD-dependent epimerase/dehydratase family protein [uncultured Tateyamaria sp.]